MSRSMTPHVLKLGIRGEWSALRPGRCTPGRIAAAAIKQEAVWASGPVCTLRRDHWNEISGSVRQEEFLCSCGRAINVAESII